MTRKEAKSCIGTIELLQRLAYNIHGVMDVIDAGNCKKIIEALKKEPNWIKCSEHLPKFDVDVLATTKEYGDVVKVTRWRTILKDCGWEWVLVDDTEGNAYNSDEIIAWMPLPQPYKAESEE